MKKIIHLSDLHIGHDDCSEKFRAIINKIILQFQPAKNYVIVITGDIVDNANKGEQTKEAVDAFEYLKKQGFRVLVVPGNHDYGTGVMGNPKFVGIFKEKYFKSLDISYPKLDIIDEIAFIGLDSTAEELHWHDRFLSQGELGKEQLMRLHKILNEPEIASLKKVVYLHHHPIDFKFGMQLRDNVELEKIITGKVDSLLFGHYHSEIHYSDKTFHGTWEIARCYNAGSSTHKNGDAGFHRIIDLSDPNPGADYDGNFFKISLGN